MSKKDKRIKKMEQLNADMAIECDEMEMTISRLHGSNIKLIDGLLRIRKERDELQRYIDDLAPVAVWKAHAKETAVYADEMKAENTELKSRIKTITTAAVDWAEHGSALIAELLDIGW